MKIELKEYDIVFDNIENINQYLDKIASTKKLFVVTDQTVYDLYYKEFLKVIKGYQVFFYIANDKNMKNYNKILNKLFTDKITKNDLLIALGGGMIGDLTGFIASTIFRGIKYVQIPTTLLSQIDSSVGGKTALDTKFGKNLIGAFYNPKLVLIDINFLNTLDIREYNNGLVEAIKMAILFDETLFDKIKNTKKLDLEDIVTIIEYKKKIVKVDFFDNNKRRLLNFGHTFGHQIEKTNKYQTYKHGEAVSQGILIILSIGEKLGYGNQKLFKEVSELFAQLNLVKKTVKNYKKYLKTLSFDKKTEVDGIDLILVKDVGKPQIVRVEVSKLWDL